MENEWKLFGKVFPNQRLSENVLITMFNKLIIDVFEKAKLETQSEVLTHHAIHLTDYLWEKERFQINERTLRNYYRSAVSKNEEINIKLSPKVTQLFCHYLGYDSYQKFINNNSNKKSINNNPFKDTKKTLIITLSITCILLLFISWYYKSQINKHAEKNSTQLIDTTTIETLSLEEFTDIKDGDYKVITIDSSIKIMYGKTKKGNYKLFSLSKALKPKLNPQPLKSIP